MQLRLATQRRFEAADGTPRELAPLDAALLAWLALEGSTPRVRLAQLLWPDKDIDAARNTLRQRLFQLRKHVGFELVVGSTTLSLAEGVRHDLDAADTVLHGAAPEDIARGEFAHWLEAQRTRRNLRVRRAVSERADAAEAARDWQQALAHATELLALDPLGEDTHRRLMRLHYLAGDRAAALLAFDRCERMLKDDVGARPSDETLALLATIEAEGGPLAASATPDVPAGVLRPPRLVGRDRELEAMHAGFRERQVVAVLGEAGMGKSRVLQAFAQAHRGIAGCAARSGDAAVPFASLARLLRAVVAAGWSRTRDAGGEDAGAPGAGTGTARDGKRVARNGTTGPDDTSAQRAIAQVLPEWNVAPASTTGELHRLALLQGVRTLLAAQPSLEGVFVDDLHFADAASLELLRLLVDDEAEAAADSRRPGWLFAYRPVEAGSPLQALHEGLAEHARWQAVTLSPLSEAALAELVDSLNLPGQKGAVLAPHLLRRTGGNPLFVLETIKQAWSDGTLDQIAAPLPRPPSVMRLIERRLSQLSQGAIALARCAAIAGQSFTPALAAKVLNVHPLALADAWAELEAAQIVRDQQFAHDLYHEAALASVPRAIARHLHGEVAEELERAQPRTTAPATLAEHWLAADQPGRAAPHLEAAAKAALDALDQALAARFLGMLAQARAAIGADDDAFNAGNEAVAALSRLEHGEEFAAAVERLSAFARTAEQRATVCEHRAAMFHFRGNGAQAAEIAAEGLSVLGPDGAPLRRLSLLNLQGMILRRAGRFQEARAALEQSVALARVTPEASEDLPQVLNNLALVSQEVDDHLGACGLLQEAAGLMPEPSRRSQILNNLAVSLVARGQTPLAYEQCLAAARLSATSKTEGISDLNLAISLGNIALLLGRYREAIAHLERGEHIAESVSPHHLVVDLHRIYVPLWLDLGRVNQARQSLARAIEACAKPEAHFPLALTRLRFMLAVGEDWSEMLAKVEETTRADGHWRVLRRVLLFKAQVQPPAEAVVAMEELLKAPAVRDNAGAAIPVQVRLAQALLATGQPERARRPAERAADALDNAWPHDMQCAEVWLTLARVLDACGDKADAYVAADRGCRWVKDVAARHLDEAYRNGYLERNPVNRDLHTLAARLAPR